MSETPHPDHDDQQPTTTASTGQGGRGRLLRSRDDRIIGGVCGGLGRYFGIDPLIVRIGAVALAFIGAAGLIAYLVALAFVPEDDGQGQPVTGSPSRTATIAGAAVIVVAGILLLDGGWGLHPGWFLGPLIPLVVVVGILAFAGRRLLRDGGDRPTAGRIAGVIVIAIAAIAAAGLAFVGSAWITALGGGDIIAAIVIALGVAMIVGSFRDSRARWLAVPALILAVPAGVVAAADVDVHGGIGQRAYHPATVADLKRDYRLGVGEQVLDLRAMAWPRGGRVAVRVHQGVGHVLVLVGDDVCVRADTKVGAGYVNVLGDETGGADMNDVHGTTRRAQGRRLLLNAELGMGAVEVAHRRHAWDVGPNDGRSISAALADAGCAGQPA